MVTLQIRTSTHQTVVLPRGSVPSLLLFSRRIHREKLKYDIEFRSCPRHTHRHVSLVTKSTSSSHMSSQGSSPKGKRTEQKSSTAGHDGSCDAELAVVLAAAPLLRRDCNVAGGVAEVDRRTADILVFTLR